MQKLLYVCVRRAIQRTLKGHAANECPWKARNSNSLCVIIIVIIFSSLHVMGIRKQTFACADALNSDSFANGTTALRTETVHEIRAPHSISPNVAIPGSGNSKWNGFFFFFLRSVPASAISRIANGRIIKIYNNKIRFAFGSGSFGQREWNEVTLSLSWPSNSKRNTEVHGHAQSSGDLFSNATTDLNIMTKKRFTFTPTAAPVAMNRTFIYTNYVWIYCAGEK